MSVKGGEVNFGAIVATIGSILIALGFAWLIASNWHGIPDFIKVLILVFATLASLIVGMILRIKEYGKIGGSLIILGSLLYALSIVLIAQIYHLATSMQVTAWLALLIFAGTMAIAYILDSSSSLVIGMAEFLIWLWIQFGALMQNVSRGQLGLLAILYLAVGALIYGLNLIHSSSNHKFSRVYKWWTSFYILALAFIFTFQTAIPYLGFGDLQIGHPVVLFVLAFAFISVITLAVGAFLGMGKKTTSMKEILLVLLVFAFLIGLIFSGLAVSGTLGTCYPKNCYDIKSESSCNGAVLQDSKCAWDDKTCQQLSCYMLKTEQACTNADIPSRVCKWNNGVCNEAYCGAYSGEDICESAPSRMNCSWSGNYCNSGNSYSWDNTLTETCNKNTNNKESCLGNTKCNWTPGGSAFYSRTQNLPFGVLFTWIIANIAFLLLIIGIIGYGTREGSTKIINLAIGAFVVDIISRYIGFIMDLSGYRLILPLVFVTGGLLLIVGGWAIEKWRRSLIKEATEKINQSD